MSEAIRVALVSTPHLSVPPVGYGGTELVVGELARALADRGVEVVLYATGDSHVPGVEVRSSLAVASWPPDRRIERVHAAWAMRDVARDGGFDVVHVHGPGAVEVSGLSPAPVICTMHHVRDPELTALYERNPDVRLVAISQSQARHEPAGYWAVVHHGLDPARYQPLPDQGYLLFLGRYDRVKGVREAIEVAARAKLPLVMAGKPHEGSYFKEEVLPLLRRNNVLDVGPVGGAAKARLIARARALLFPIQWEEPFGLVMIESMLCGVPVLATARGSVPEIVEDGVTGVVCDDPSEMVGAARVADRLFDRGLIRRLAVERWSAQRMAGDYLMLYRAAIADRQPFAEPAAEGAEPASEPFGATGA